MNAGYLRIGLWYADQRLPPSKMNFPFCNSVKKAYQTRLGDSPVVEGKEHTDARIASRIGQGKLFISKAQPSLNEVPSPIFHQGTQPSFSILFDSS